MIKNIGITASSDKEPDKNRIWLDLGSPEDAKLKYFANNGWSTISNSVPNGGLKGQVLGKLSDEDGEAGWINQSGGGPSGGINIRVKSLIDTAFTVANGQSIIIRYNFSSIDTSTSEPTGKGTAIYLVNGTKVLTESIEQGDTYIDITSYIKVGNSSLEVSITDIYGNNRKLLYDIEVIDISISSTFDDFIIYNSSIIFRYTPIGSIEKTIHFILDGIVLPDIVTSSTNRQLTLNLPKLNNGVHTLKCYMTATVTGSSIESNILFYEFIFADSTSVGTFISSSFNINKSNQYETLNIPFLVYNSSKTSVEIDLIVNGKKIQSLLVDRGIQNWNYLIQTEDNLEMKIQSQDYTKTLNIDVIPSETQLEEVIEDLDFKLSSIGRNNSSTDKDIWEYNGYNTIFKNFNWIVDGWQKDINGNTALTMFGGSSIILNYKLFNKDFKVSGKTITFEYSISDVIDYNEIFLSCEFDGIGININPDGLVFKSNQSNLNIKFSSFRDKVSISLVITKQVEYRLIYVYINGVVCGTVQYPSSDNFKQSVPQNINIGSKTCTVRFYGIRVYDNNLNATQILDNYIYDIENSTEKLQLYNRNNITLSDGSLAYSKVLDYVPIMTLVGILPTYKGDKKKVDIIYENKQNPNLSFTISKADIDVQGTSSQYYPRKNWKISTKTGFNMTSTGYLVPKYSLKEGSIPSNVFCTKADFAESSGTHNIGLAQIGENLLKELGLLTPPQKTDLTVRTTIEGYPCVIYHKETNESTATFLGKYNFNTDKASIESFGFSGKVESWEFLNNTSQRTLFQKSDYVELDNEGNLDWKNDFEARYPDKNTNVTNFKILTDWIVECKDNPTKFKEECSKHFNVKFLLFYYLFTEHFGMVDQRAKNMFATSWGNEGDGDYKWYFILYDNDTCLGINNEGVNTFSFNIETGDIVNSQQVWNGANSTLWKNVSIAYDAELREMYYQMRQSNALTIDKCYNILEKAQSDKWSEVVYNEDGHYKYIDPLINQGVGAYLYANQGNRKRHRNWWLSNRFNYMDSRFNAGSFRNDYATMRIYTPPSWGVVTPNADFNISLISGQYTTVKYGSYLVSKRGNNNDIVTIKSPNIVFNDTETIIYGISNIKSLGDLSNKYAGTVDLSKALLLESIYLGSGEEGYSNKNLHSLYIGNNKSLKILDVRNCSNFNQPIDLSLCDNINTVKATGTIIQSITFPKAGNLQTLYLPNSTTSIILGDQPSLNDFLLESIDNVIEINIGKNNIGYELVKKCLLSPSKKLNTVRLSDIDIRNESNLNTLIKIIKFNGFDVNGNNIPNSYISGKFHSLIVTPNQLQKVNKAFPDLQITYDQINPDTPFNITINPSLGVMTEIVFTSNFEYIKNGNTYSIYDFEIGDTINFTHTALNYKDISDSILITEGWVSKTYIATYIPLRTIIVIDGETKVPLKGAIVTVDNDQWITNDEGKVFIRNGNKIIIQVTYPTYGRVINEFTAIEVDRVNTINMFPAVSVKFNIRQIYINTIISGASVICNGQEIKSDGNGDAIFPLPRGATAIPFTVICGGYLPVNSTINVPSSSPTYLKYVDMNIDVIYRKPIENGNIQYLIGSFKKHEMTINSTTNDFIINWGDGNKDEGIVGQNSFEHVYVSSGTYLIEIENCKDIVSINFLNNASYGWIYAYYSNGNFIAKTLRLSGQSDLEYLGDNVFNYTLRTDFGGILTNCPNLAALPNNLFRSAPLCKNVNSALTYTKVQIPNDLFSDNPKITDFSSCFLKATIESIPSGLFDNNIDCTTFAGCFQLCSKLKTVPIDLFNKNINVTDFSNCFNNCNNITSNLPPLWQLYYGKVVTKTNCFTGCTKAANWAEVPVSWGGTAPEWVPLVPLEVELLNKRLINIESEVFSDRYSNFVNTMALSSKEEQ